jgi:hypothetical protein
MPEQAEFAFGLLRPINRENKLILRGAILIATMFSIGACNLPDQMNARKDITKGFGKYATIQFGKNRTVNVTTTSGSRISSVCGNITVQKAYQNTTLSGKYYWVARHTFSTSLNKSDGVKQYLPHTWSVVDSASEDENFNHLCIDNDQPIDANKYDIAFVSPCDGKIEGYGEESWIQTQLIKRGNPMVLVCEDRSPLLWESTKNYYRMAPPQQRIVEKYVKDYRDLTKVASKYFDAKVCAEVKSLCPLFVKGK